MGAFAMRAAILLIIIGAALYGLSVGRAHHTDHTR
jgi:hypothetical protein